MRAVTRKLLSGLTLLAGMAGRLAAQASPTLYLFSEVSGQVLDRGQPVKGAKLERTYSWADDRITDQTITDDEGRYRFPEITGRSLILSIIPHETRIIQSINIYHDGSVYAGWFFVKGNYDKNGELGDRSLSLVCDFQTKEGPFVETKHYGICGLQ